MLSISAAIEWITVNIRDATIRILPSEMFFISILFYFPYSMQFYVILKVPQSPRIRRLVTMSINSLSIDGLGTSAERICVFWHMLLISNDQDSSPSVHLNSMIGLVTEVW